MMSFTKAVSTVFKFNGTHLKRENIKSNLSVPGIQGCHENALYKSFETSPNSIFL